MRGLRQCLAQHRGVAVAAMALVSLALCGGAPAMADVVWDNAPEGSTMLEAGPEDASSEDQGPDADGLQPVEGVRYVSAGGTAAEAPVCTPLAKDIADGKLAQGWYYLGGSDHRLDRPVEVDGEVNIVLDGATLRMGRDAKLSVAKGAKLRLYAAASPDGTATKAVVDGEGRACKLVENRGLTEVCDVTLSGASDVAVYNAADSEFHLVRGSICDSGTGILGDGWAFTRIVSGRVERNRDGGVSGGRLAVSGATVVRNNQSFDVLVSEGRPIKVEGRLDKGARIGVKYPKNSDTAFTFGFGGNNNTDPATVFFVNGGWKVVYKDSEAYVGNEKAESKEAEEAEEPTEAEESTEVEEPTEAEESTEVEEPTEAEEPKEAEEPTEDEEPTESEEEPNPEAITYLDEKGRGRNTGGKKVTDISDPSFKVENGYSLGDGWYVVKKSRDFGKRLTIDGDVKLILCDGVEANFKDGIHGKSGKFTIYAQSTGEEMGKLIAKARYNGYAGIGGDDGVPNGSEIVICGGRIEAKGQAEAACIGGGYEGGCGTVRILGGDVTAKSDHEAGIGSGGFAQSGGSVVIAGGRVTAQGGKMAPGIGSVGAGEKCPVDVLIAGGDVTVKGGKYAAGIGGHGRCTVTITDGTVTATGGKWGAGIGTGDEAEGGKVKISGGDVTAKGGQYAAGIGGGNEAKCEVEISGGTIDATGGEWGAGIGTGDECGSGGKITISGGDVTATSGDKGAGIGGGNETDGGEITISGGTVHAWGVDGDGVWDWMVGTSGGAGVGGGDEGNSGTIKITGGDVTAEAKGEKACAIGRGDDGKNKDITLGNKIKVVGKEGKTLTGDDRYDAIKSWHWTRTMPV